MGDKQSICTGREKLGEEKTNNFRMNTVVGRNSSEQVGAAQLVNPKPFFTVVRVLRCVDHLSAMKDQYRPIFNQRCIP